ncbi:MAG: acetyltransferase [Anaerolineae bacterium]|nr:acetyltransferase [Anaerolineae bacterium]
MKDLVIFGAGAVGRLVCQIASDINAAAPTWHLRGFLAHDSPQPKELCRLPLLGDAQWLQQRPDVHVVVAIGDSVSRRKVVSELTSLGHETFATLVHPTAWIGSRVKIGTGSIIYPGSLIDPDVTIESHALINKSCTIGHDTVIEAYATLSPGVNIGGSVAIGEGCEFGINSATVQGINIGHWSVIGAGATVISDLDANVTVVGVPARVIRTREEGWHRA